MQTAISQRNIKVDVFRTAMCGGGLSYDVYVPVSQIPNYDGARYTTIHRQDGMYVDFPQATLPEEHFAMPLGWDRYADWLAHEKVARVKMLEIARTVYVELYNAKLETLPSLWINGLMDKETHDMRSARVLVGGAL